MGPPYADINNIAKLCDNTGVARNEYTISKEVEHRYKKAAYYQSLWNNPCNRRLFIPAGINRNDYFRIPKCRWGITHSALTGPQPDFLKIIQNQKQIVGRVAPSLSIIANAGAVGLNF